jgi:hypothetical protein
MLRRILRDLAISFVLCLGERMLERVLFPGLHHLAGRAVTDDPSRIDSFDIVISEAVGLFLMIWLFNGTLYAVAWLIRRPLRPLVPTFVTIIILILTLAGSFATWYTTPSLPPMGR